VREQLTQAQAQASEAAAIREALKAAQDTVKAERDAWTQERTMLERGLTSAEARDAALFFHSRLPAEGRPELAAWLDEIRQDPTKAQAGMRAYLPQAAATTTAATTTTTTTAAQVQRRVESTPSAGSVVSVEAIRAAGERARSGRKEDLDALAALRARLAEERRR
jgi:hypothetical protein